jgi:hypothetical protein
VGVGGPLLKMKARVSSLSPPRENHLLEFSDAPEVGSWEVWGAEEELGVCEVEALLEEWLLNCDCN